MNTYRKAQNDRFVMEWRNEITHLVKEEWRSYCCSADCPFEIPNKSPALSFTDENKPLCGQWPCVAIRLFAIMGSDTIDVFTHWRSH